MSDLIISGVIDGPLNGRPRAVELTVLSDILDLSIYAVGAANNGLGTDGAEFTLFGPAQEGDRLYLSADSEEFRNFFGFEPNFSDVSALNSIDGNDAIELFRDTGNVDEQGDPILEVVDVFGYVNFDDDPMTDSWSYRDGWASRTSGSADGSTFIFRNWEFSGANALDDELNNATAANPFPIPAVYIVESDGSTEISDDGMITDVYTVVLNTQPTDTVIVTITPDGQTDIGNGEGQPLLLTFTPSNYNVAQTVTVTAFDDDEPTNNGQRSILHTSTSSDANYDSTRNSTLFFNPSNATETNVVAPITVASAGVSIVESDGSTIVSENGSLQDFYDITLATSPTADVFVTVDPDDQTDLGEGQGNAITLMFLAGATGEGLTKRVAVEAVGDMPIENEHTSTITHSFVSIDPNYDNNTGTLGAVPDVIVTVLETGITITALATDPLVEGSATAYNVVLNSSPEAEVKVTINPDEQTDLGQGAGNPIELTFAANATGEDLTKTVSVTAVDDDDSTEGTHQSTITHTAESTDSNYSTLDGLTIDDAIVNITDAGITIEAVTLNPVPEGSSTTYNVVLSSNPTATVTVNIMGDTDTSANPTSLIFEPGGDLSQSVTITAISDTEEEGNHTGTITHTSSSADLSYNNLAIDDVTINITDPGVSITETGGSTTVSELGVDDTYTIALNSVPTDVMGNPVSITITVDPDDQTSINDMGFGVAVPLTFDADNLTQTVTVAANPDGIDEGGPHTSNISHEVTASTAADYPEGFSIAGVTATVIDCFLTGTLLLTDRGERPVEELKIGDRLQTLEGQLKSIKWIGIQTCSPNSQHYHPLRTFPIRVKAGALGNNLPIRDLYVSPDHALLVEGILINAGALENGISIVRVDPTPESFVYYHIELDHHNLIIAEGTPAESYLPQKQDRTTFDNGDDYAALYPESNMQALIPMRYPRVSSKRQLPRFIAKSLRKIANGIAPIPTPSTPDLLSVNY